VRLPEGLRLREVETTLDGRVARDRALTHFLPQGYATPTWVHLEDDQGNPYTVVIRALPGQVGIYDGRVDPD
jgi:cell wall assembly regulator SMI1